MGYFLEPIFVTAIGVFLFHEKMSRLEQMTALFSIIGVGYLMGVYRMVPVMAMVIGLSFAFYGAVKKSVHLDAGLSPVCRDLICNSDRAAVLCLQRNERTRKSGSSSWNAVFTVSNGRCDHIRSIAVI